VYGLQITGDVQDDMTVDSVEYNATGNTLEAVAEIPEKLPTVVTVIMAAVIIGVLLRYLYVRFT